MFAIDHNADNSLITLRYRLKDADIQIAEDPFEAGGTKFARGSFVITGVSRAIWTTRRRSLVSRPMRSRPRHRSVRTRPAPPGSRSCTVGHDSDRRLVASAFDVYRIPYDYIDPQKIRDTANLRAKYNVIVVGPGGSQALVQGMPMWRNPIP